MVSFTKVELMPINYPMLICIKRRRFFYVHLQSCNDLVPIIIRHQLIINIKMNYLVMMRNKIMYRHLFLIFNQLQHEKNRLLRKKRKRQDDFFKFKCVEFHLVRFAHIIHCLVSFFFFFSSPICNLDFFCFLQLLFYSNDYPIEYLYND